MKDAKMTDDSLVHVINIVVRDNCFTSRNSSECLSTDLKTMIMWQEASHRCV